MKNPAIVCVAYDREESLKRLLKSISRASYENNNVPLIISIDYAKDNSEVVFVAESFEWEYGEKIVVTHEQNLGLRKHILECGDYAVTYGSVIILEDDLVVAPGFYKFAKDAQEYYKEDSRIAGVSLYSHEWNGYVRRSFMPVIKNGDVYFGQFGVSWGQCWNKRQWTDFKNWYLENQILEYNINVPVIMNDWSQKSWGKYFNFYIVEKNKYYVVPYRAFSTCFTEAGEHFNYRCIDHQVRLDLGEREYDFVDFEEGSHYDIFFENQDLGMVLKKYIVDEREVCIDLYGNKGVSSRKYKYILTTQKLKYDKIKSFGKQMRPIEMNVLYEIEGDEIFLYQKDDKIVKNKKRYN